MSNNTNSLPLFKIAHKLTPQEQLKFLLLDSYNKHMMSYTPQNDYGITMDDIVHFYEQQIDNINRYIPQSEHQPSIPIDKNIFITDSNIEGDEAEPSIINIMTIQQTDQNISERDEFEDKYGEWASSFSSQSDNDDHLEDIVIEPHTVADQQHHQPIDIDDPSEINNGVIPNDMDDV